MNSCTEINDYISVKQTDYDKCIDVIEHDYVIKGINSTVRLHYLKFDGNGKPMVEALANTLYTYIIDYCLSARNRKDPLTAQQATLLTKEARKLFRHPTVTDKTPDKTGEAGELLLYFLLEAVLKAPQVVAKMELKTNPNDEVKGSDGMHARWNEKDAVIDFFFGEAKLYKSSAAAIASAIESVNQFHNTKMYQHEFTMVTKHFKFADEKTKAAISSMIIHGEPGSNVRVNHACLIGYDFKGYKSLNSSREKLTKDFCSLFLADGERLVSLLQKRFDGFDKKHLNFEVFFIPFPSVVDFRNAFNDALN